MSASREKKIRQDLAAKGITDPKAIREAEEKDQQHRSNMLYGGIAVVFVLVAAFLLLWNSNVLQRGATAVTVDGEKYSAAEVDYFYYNAYSSIRQNQYASYMGIDTSKPLSQQDLSSMAKLMLGVDEDMTWDAYLKQNAKNQLIQMTVLNKAAKDAGFEFTDDMQAQVDKNMDQLASYAKQKGVSTAAYLKNVYGKNMTTSVFKKLLTEGIYVSAYDQSYQNGLSYTDNQIAAYYADNKNDFDVVNYEYILFKGTANSTKDDSGNTVQPTDEQNAAALAAAQEAAAAALSRAKAGGSLEDIAKDYDMATYSSQEEGTYNSSSALSAWVFDANRQSGDCDMVNDGSNYYIALYHSRTRHDYNTVDVRHILFRVDGSAKRHGELQHLRIIVRDDGLGMSKDYLATIFDSFTREESSLTNKVQGTGLGMAITKNLVDLMGGTISVESELGTGSTFIVDLDFPPAGDESDGTEGDGGKRAGNASGTDGNALAHKHVLVAEDNALNAEVITAILNIHDATCEVAVNGEEAVAKFGMSAPDTFDMIFMDVQMPVMNGHDAARAIRAMDRPDAGTIPIIAMTANAFAEDERQALAAGMNAHVAKPIDVHTLERVVAKLSR